MPDPLATPDDVRVEYETELDDPEISPYIDRASREVDRYVDVSGMADPDRRDLEAALAAYWIATRSSDRAAESVTSGRTSMDYEAEVVEEIRSTVESLDPSGDLPPDHREQADFEVF